MPETSSGYCLSSAKETDKNPACAGSLHGWFAIPYSFRISNSRASLYRDPLK